MLGWLPVDPSTADNAVDKVLFSASAFVKLHSGGGIAQCPVKTIPAFQSGFGELVFDDVRSFNSGAQDLLRT